MKGRGRRLEKEGQQSTSCIFVSVILISSFEHIYALREDVAQVSSAINMWRVMASGRLRTVHFGCEG